MSQANIKAVITAEDQASGVLGNFGKNIAQIGVPLLAVGAAITAFGVSAVRSFSDSESVASQLNAVLKSTGGIAGVTAESATSLATALQKTTRYSDEAIGSAQNMLLTFTNIGKDIFPDTTRAVLDMSTAMGTDLKSTAIQVGKALQDPVQGVTALQRVGVRLTDSQKELIETLVNTGRSAEAQKIILGELQREFGGSAEAAGKTFAGQLDIAKNALDDVMESIGKVVADGLKPFVDNIKPIISGVQDWISKNPQLVGTIVAVTAAIGVLSLAFGGLAIVIGIVDTVGAPFIALGFAIVAVLGVMAFATKAIIDHFGGVKGVMSALQPTVDRLKDVWQNLVNVWQGAIIPAIRMLWGVIQSQLLPALERLWSSIKDEVTNAAITLAVIIGGAVVASILQFIMVLTALTVVTTKLIEGFTWLNNVMYPHREAVDATADAHKRVSEAANGVFDSTNRVVEALNRNRDAARELKDANLNLEGSGLAVERAQNQYNEALRRYGPTSIETRTAAYNLKTAQQQLSDATNAAASASDKSKQANENLKNAIPAQAAAISHLTGIFRGQKDVLANLDGFGQQYIRTLQGISNQPNLGAMSGSVPSYLRRAGGGPVSDNTAYIVGEKGPELFVPNGNGKIIPNNEVRESSSNSTVVNINVGMMTGSATEQREAAMRIFENLQDIANTKGQTVAQMIGV